MKTVAELSTEHNIGRSTLLKAVQQGRIPGHQSGATWIINDESETFKSWLCSRSRKVAA